MHIDNGEAVLSLKPKIKLSTVVQLVVDAVILALVIGTFYCLQTIKPFNRGFYCDDDSLKYPLVDDTVSIDSLLYACIFIPLFLTAILEFFNLYRVAGVWQAVLSFLRIYSFCLLGLYASLDIAEVARKTIGRLRPFFFEMCKPVYDQQHCDKDVYITEYNCTSGVTEEALNASKSSNPSSHSLLAGYTAIWIVVYLQYRMVTKYTYFLKYVGQCIAFSAGYWMCMTRISDYKHHPEDVLTGALLGAICAMWTLYVASGHVIFDINKSSFASADDVEDVYVTRDRDGVYGGQRNATSLTSFNNLQKITVGQGNRFPSSKVGPSYSSGGRFVYDYSK